MSNSLAYHRVDRSQAQSVEPLGSKFKFWYVQCERRFLFKADDRGTGEDWAEVIACELADLLGLPCVHYELAAEYDKERYVRPGVICASMAPEPLSLALGNQFLLANDPSYPMAQRFKVKQHTVDAVVEAVGLLEPPAAEWMMNVPPGVHSALDVFTGYVMLDAWIANQDRHHENWGALWDGATMRLAPTFDHGAGLARNLTDAEREDRMNTKDIRRTVRAFAEKGRSALYLEASDSRAMLLLDAFRAFSERKSAVGKVWTARLASIPWASVESAVLRIPGERMSEATKRFTLELLRINCERLTA